MNEIEIVKTLMAAQKMSYGAMAAELGYNNPSGVSNRLYDKSLKTELLISMLNTMGYDLIIRSKENKKETYVVTNEGRAEK